VSKTKIPDRKMWDPRTNSAISYPGAKIDIRVDGEYWIHFWDRNMEIPVVAQGACHHLSVACAGASRSK
jgi:hypothetical protein